MFMPSCSCQRTHATNIIFWKKFQEITNKSNIPIYALGGLGPKDYETSIENGGIGIASQRLIWK